MQRRGMLRLACAHAAQVSAQAVDLVYNAAGGTAIFETGRLERCFGDVHAVTQHIGVVSRRVGRRNFTSSRPQNRA